MPLSKRAASSGIFSWAISSSPCCWGLTTCAGVLILHPGRGSCSISCGRRPDVQRGGAVTLQQARHALGIGPPPAALGADPEAFRECPGGVDAGEVARAVVVVYQPEIEVGVVVAPQLSERTEIVGV